MKKLFAMLLVLALMLSAVTVLAEKPDYSRSENRRRRAALPC